MIIVHILLHWMMKEDLKRLLKLVFENKWKGINIEKKNKRKYIIKILYQLLWYKINPKTYD